MALPYIVGANGPMPVSRVRFDVFPAGDVHLCAEDMARFLAAHLNGGAFRVKRILSEASVEEAHRSQFGSYGFGWSVGGANTHSISHNGGVAGFLTLMSGDLEANVGVYIMSNSGDLNRIGRAAIVLLRGEEWEVAADPVEIELPEEVLEEYVGRYELTPDLVLTVTREGTSLFTQATGQGRLEVFASARDEFFLRVVYAQLSFLRNDEGEVNRVVLHQNGDHEGHRIE